MEQGDKKQEIRKFAEKLKPFLNEIASNTPSFLSPLRVLFEAIEKVLGWKLTDGDRSAIRNLTTGDKDLLSEFAKDEGVNARFSFIPQDDNRFFRKKAPAPTLGPERQPRPETSQTFPKTELVYRVPQNPKAAEKKENLTAEQEEFMKMPQIELVNLVIKLKEENRKLKRIDPAMNGNTQIRTYGSRTDNTPSQSARSVKPNNCTYFRQEDPLARPKSQQNRSSRQKNGAGPSKIQVEVPKKEPLAVVKVEKKPEISISFLEINEESKKAAVETQKVMQELDEFLKMAERVNLLGAMGRLEMRKNAILNVYSIAVQNIHHYEQEKFREMQPLPPIPQPDYEDYRRIRQIFNDFCDSNDDQVQTPTSSSSHEFLASNNVPATSSFTAKPNIFAANPWRNSGNNKKEDVVEADFLACEICGNYAHATCYGVWLERNGTCIHCRSSLKDPQEYPTLA
ncbi:unnamed protein product [Caenorhabditis auriculariae]|uniref:Uncharacterized protein n=1 Tax=Caenorhabditis auriculariae TaxID=2777116 RepID=A0A8S1HAF3_9PELO|nr:unnamed protein product [Caenorhabditis auriculariae]